MNRILATSLAFILLLPAAAAQINTKPITPQGPATNAPKITQPMQVKPAQPAQSSQNHSDPSNPLGLPGQSTQPSDPNGPANTGTLTGCIMRTTANPLSSADPRLGHVFRYKVTEASMRSPAAVGDWFTINLTQDKFYIIFQNDRGFPPGAHAGTPGQWDTLVTVLSGAAAANVKIHFDWTRGVVNQTEIYWDQKC